MSSEWQKYTYTTNLTQPNLSGVEHFPRKTALAFNQTLLSTIFGGITFSGECRNKTPTWPMMTSDTSSGLTDARLKASLITIEP